MINIAELDKVEVLIALYNNAKPLGLGWLCHEPKNMSRVEAENQLEKSTYFDYINGRVMKVNLLSDTEFDPYLYDRDNGNGAAYRAIDSLRK